MTFIGFSTRKQGKITLHNTKDVTGVTAELREPILGLTVAEYTLTAEEIAAGSFTIPETESGDLYMAHMDEYDATYSFPEELELHVTVRYNSAEGEKTLKYTVKDSPEQGWSMSYWPDDEPETEFTWPGCFRFASFESTVPISFVVDEPDKVKTAADGNVISVSLSIDGRKVLPEECRLEEELKDDPLAELYGVPAEQKYYAYLILKRPDWAPEHGTIHMTVVQELSEGGIWTTEKDLAY